MPRLRFERISGDRDRARELPRSVLRNVSPHAEERGGTSEDRTYFMARLGLFTSIAFVLVIVALTIPKFILSPCE